MFHSLFWKISFSVGLVVTLTLSVFAFFLLQTQQESLLASKRKEVESLSAFFAQGVTRFMKEGEKKDIHNFLNLFAVSDDLVEVRILDEGGTVLHSSRGTEVGSSLASSFPGGILDPQRPPVFEQKIRGLPFLGTLRPFRNEPACFSCHGDRKRILGVLHVALAMEDTRRNIQFNRNLLIAATALTLLLTGLAINLLLARLVKKPIGRLVETMSQVERGDLEAKPDLSSQDELGRLARSFKSMLEKLGRAKKEVEEQHRRQVLQVQHLASLGELAAGVAHEIRNPLAGIKLAVEALAKDPSLPPGHRETTTEITRSIERLNKTMTDLLLYSRLRPPELSPVSLSDVIQDSLSSLREELQRAGIQVEKNLDPRIPPLLLDGEQVARVFLNLFLNALQAMPAGGTLTIGSRLLAPGQPLPGRNGIPGEDLPADKNWAEVSVGDTGGGIRPEIREDIFRPFFTTKAKGTGLGLYLSRRIIEQHGGWIFAESGVGRGTKFFLVLPVPAAPERAVRGTGEAA